MSLTLRPIPLHLAFLMVASLFATAGCVGPQASEQQSRVRLKNAAVALHLGPAESPMLPSADASLSDYIRYAMIKHPAVAAAYYDWRSAVESIAISRSLPDPQFTFEADVADTLMTFMPGVMFDVMSREKRAAMAHEASVTSEIAYRKFVTQVVQTGAELRNAWIELGSVDTALRLREASMAAIRQASALEASNYATTRGMASLEAQVLFANQAAQIQSVVGSLEDRRSAARARFKSALGLSPADPDPVWPQVELTATALPDEKALWQQIELNNPELRSMRAMVDMAVASVQTAERAKSPDFGLGAMVDLKAQPLMVRPLANITLPIWREKIAAGIAAAQAKQSAAEERVAAERLNLAAEFAQMLYMVRESDRMIAYISETALPNLARSSESAEAAYQAGMSTAAMIPQARLMALGMELERVEALRTREINVTGIYLMSAHTLPPEIREPLTAAEP